MSGPVLNGDLLLSDASVVRLCRAVCLASALLGISSRQPARSCFPVVVFRGRPGELARIIAWVQVSRHTAAQEPRHQQ